MNSQLLEKLSAISEEERDILDGRKTIDRDIYMNGEGNRVNAKKLLASGKLITLRPHTRFIRFPKHTHDYVEVVYMCSGGTTHIVDGTKINLKQGELLFMHQSATHEVLRSGESDIAVNFIVLPEFFNTTLSVLGDEETPLRRFLVDCLCGQSVGVSFLHFQVADVPIIQNLAENLLLILTDDIPNKRKSSQMTMALLFLQLMNYTGTLESGDRIVQVLSYIEEHFADGSLTELSAHLHTDLCSLSREIRRKTGKTYTQLVQEKRLAQAAFLLRNTDKKVDDIAAVVGYENTGYFHKLFAETYHTSPRKFRLQTTQLKQPPCACG